MCPDNLYAKISSPIKTELTDLFTINPFKEITGQL